MSRVRTLVVVSLLLMLAAPLAACVVHTEGRATTYTTHTRQHTWYYYPSYDLYYSPTASVWIYWGGTHWVQVDRRPRWIAVSPSAYSVTLSYYGMRPYRYWDYHWRDYRHRRPAGLQQRAPRTWHGPVDERGLRPTAPRQAPRYTPRTSPRPADERGLRSRTSGASSGSSSPGPVDERGRRTRTSGSSSSGGSSGPVNESGLRSRTSSSSSGGGSSRSGPVNESGRTTQSTGGRSGPVNESGRSTHAHNTSGGSNHSPALAGRTTNPRPQQAPQPPPPQRTAPRTPGTTPGEAQRQREQRERERQARQQAPSSSSPAPTTPPRTSPGRVDERGRR